MLKGHGDDTYRYNEIRINFSSNIYNHFDHTALFRHLSNRMHDVCSYPEPIPATLESRIAASHNIPADCVMATNGATEAIYLIAQTFRQADSSILQPTFAEYADACHIHAHTINNISTLPLQSLPPFPMRPHCSSSLPQFPAFLRRASTPPFPMRPHRVPSPNTHHPSPNTLVWLCNPNNPTGTVIPKTNIIEALKANPDTLFIIDASYAAYTCEALLTPAEGIEYPNLLMLHSMTKDYGIPGIRLGYVTAHPKLITHISANRMPWSVSQVAINAALYLLDYTDHYHIDADAINHERKRVASSLEQIGIIVHPSQSNMLLCRHPHIEAATLKEYLVSEYGILIRDASNFYGLDSHHFRIAVQSQEENDTLLSTLKNLTSLTPHHSRLAPTVQN